MMFGRNLTTPVEVRGERLQHPVGSEAQPQPLDVEPVDRARLLNQRVDRVELAPPALDALAQPPQIRPRIALLGGRLDGQAGRVRAPRRVGQPHAWVDWHPALHRRLEHLADQVAGVPDLAGHAAHYVAHLKTAHELDGQLAQTGLERPRPWAEWIG